MKIVHTADWHLGKKLENKSRSSEQSDALDELNELCDCEEADLVLVAGDVFDSAVPPAEAEELFYKSVVRLAVKRPVIVLAGNHDDADRLTAPFEAAKATGVYLVGGMDNSRIDGRGLKGDFGFVRYCAGGEQLNLALLPFPSRSRMEKTVAFKENDYPAFVSGLISVCTKCFGEGINVFASHLFMDGCLITDERPGNAIVLTKEILPMAHYNALGHIHKPQCVSKSKNAYYSGSLLKYHFDENDDKEFVVFDSVKGIKHVPIKSGKQLKRVKAFDFPSAMEALDKAGDCYAELILDSSTPLKPSEAERLREISCLTKLTVINRSIKREVFLRRTQTDAEIFASYYKSVRGEEPSEDTVKAFLEVIE